MKLCPDCGKETVAMTEIGWKKLRIVGESPRGYRYAVLTTKVPTAVLECNECNWEQHGYIHENTFYVEEESVEVS